MALYEATFIARQDMSRQDITRITEQFTGIVASNGGKVVKNEYWGLRNLAYRINKNKKGHYVMLYLDAPAAAVNELARNMRISEEVVRTLTVRIDEIPEGPSAMMSRGRDDDYSSSNNNHSDASSDDVPAIVQ